MMKAYFGFVCGVMFLSVSSDAVPVLAADRAPATTLLCVRNASASRGYGFDEERWLGILVGPKPSLNPPFNLFVAGKSGPKQEITLERIFTGLDSETPTVRHIEKDMKATEFPAKTLRRRGVDSVIILWSNPPGLADWMWLAHIDRIRRVAVVTNVYDGMTYSAGELETMDCR
jgi:hypothetical protein